MTRYGLSVVSEPLDPTGIGVYALELARALGPMLASDERLVVIRHARFPRPGGHTRIEDRPLRFPARWSPLRRLVEQALVPAVARRAGVTLLHAVNHVGPLAWSRPLVVTLHDTRLFGSRAHAGPARRAFRRLVYPASVRRAARLIAVSAFAAERCADAFGVDRERVRVIPHGVDHTAAARVTPADRARALARLGVVGPVVLFAGTFEPHKNVLRLLEAFRRLAASPAGACATLVLAGGGGADTARVRERIAALGLGTRVRLPGHLAREDLLALLSAACVLALPSLEEGFGLPVLEAFAAGTPVLVSDRGALPEVAGDAALVVDPEDTEAIARGLARLLEENGLREKLVARGRERAKPYSWERTAAATLDVYRAALHTGRP